MRLILAALLNSKEEAKPTKDISESYWSGDIQTHGLDQNRKEAYWIIEGFDQIGMSNL